MTPAGRSFDLVVVGAGIVGLGHAAAALERGLSVAVVERADAVMGATVRNFGHIGVGAHAGQAHEYAQRTRELWLRLAERAGFWIRESGAIAVATHADELQLLREAAPGRILSADAVSELVPVRGATGGVVLPDDLQVDPREAGPALASHLADAGVSFFWRTAAWGVEPGILHTARGELRAGAIVIAVGADVDHILPEIAERVGIQRCGLDMLLADGVGLPMPLLTGSSLLRYSAFATAPAADDVRARFARDDPGMLAFDVNQMYTERPDGTLIVGDTHRTGVSIPPFQSEATAELLLRRGGELFGQPLRVRERWQGVYARGPQEFLVETPGDGIRVVSVLTGIGMTTGLGLAASVIDELYD